MAPFRVHPHRGVCWGAEDFPWRADGDVGVGCERDGLHPSASYMWWEQTGVEHGFSDDPEVVDARVVAGGRGFVADIPGVGGPGVVVGDDAGV